MISDNSYRERETSLEVISNKVAFLKNNLVKWLINFQNLKQLFCNSCRMFECTNGSNLKNTLEYKK